ncbi:hypothetical protein EDB86DRAFT_1283451 [Lactarius hatsudake]|nr:hypothetical protein EDB86DRAFT_1283451 [Lactarius hatsudake]
MNLNQLRLYLVGGGQCQRKLITIRSERLAKHNKVRATTIRCNSYHKVPYKSSNCSQTSCSSLYGKFKWKINGPFHPQTPNTITGSHLPRIVQVPLSNRTCLPTKGVKIISFRIVPVRGVPRNFGDVVAPYHVNQDQDVVDNRDTAMVAPAHSRAQFAPPNTGRAQDNYVPAQERAGPSNIGLLQAPTLDTSIAESRRRLASRYLNNADAHVSMIRLEPGASGQFQVIITLEMTNVF